MFKRFLAKSIGLLLFAGFGPLLASSLFSDGSALTKACDRERFSQTCLSALLVYRCASYSHDLQRTGHCLDMARNAAAVMAIRTPEVDGSTAFVAFPAEVTRLLSDPFTLRYLRTAKEGLERGFQFHRGFDLWRQTVSAAGGDTRKALWLIGVLLQDTSSSKWHLGYVGERDATKIPDENLRALSDALDLLEPEQLRARQAREWLELYPALPGEAERSFGPGLYHFYTIAYLAMRLNWMTRDPELSAFVAFLLDASYKFREIAPRRWPRDPEPFSIREKEAPLRDLYAAYLGARWATGMAAVVPSFAEFSAALAADPFHFMQKLYLGR